MKPGIVPFCFLALFSLAPPVFGGGGGGAAMGVADCVAHGLAHHPDLLHARLRVEQARQRLLAAEAYADPLLDLAFGYEDSELPVGGSPFVGGTSLLRGHAGLSREFSRGTRLSLSAARQHYDYGESPLGFSEVHTGELRAGIEQPLLRNAWGRQHRLRTLQRLDVLEQERLLLDDLANDYALRVHAAYSEAYAAAQRARLDAEALARLRRLLELNRGYLRDGWIEETDVLATEAALAVQEAECIASEDFAQIARDRLFTLVALPVERWDAVELAFEKDLAQPIAARPDAAEAFAAARVQRADWRALEKAQGAARCELDLRRDALRPALALTGSVGAGGSGPEAGDAQGLDKTAWGVGIALELNWSRRAERAAVREAELALEGLEADGDELYRQVFAECRAAARDLATGLRQLAASEKAQALQRRKLEAEQQRLAQGRSSARFVLQYEDDLQAAEARIVAARAELFRRQARLFAAQGALAAGAVE